MIVFLSPKQSEIEESSLESLSKSRIQGVWDLAHSTRVGITFGCAATFHQATATFHPAALPFTSGYAAITPGCQKIYIRLPPLYTRLSPLPPGCITSGTLLSSFYPDVSHPEFWPGDVPHSPDASHPADISGWGKRAFQLPRSDISGSADNAHPEDFAAILHSAAVFS